MKGTSWILIVSVIILSSMLMIQDADAVKELKANRVAVGNIVAIKGQTLFMPPLGMVQLWGIRIPDDVLPAEVERTVDQLNEWVAKDTVIVFIHQQRDNLRIIEIVNETHNINKRLVDEGLAHQPKRVTFRPPRAVPGQVFIDDETGVQVLSSGGSANSPRITLMDENPREVPARLGPEMTGQAMPAVDEKSGENVTIRDVPVPHAQRRTPTSLPGFEVPVGASPPVNRMAEADFPRAAPNSKPLGAKELRLPQVTLIEETSPAGAAGRGGQPVTVTTIDIDEREVQAMEAMDTGFRTETTSPVNLPNTPVATPEPEPDPAKEVANDWVNPNVYSVSDKDREIALQHYEQGREFHKANQLSEAQQQYILALKYNPKLADAQYYLSQTYVTMDEVKAARQIERGLQGQEPVDEPSSSATDVDSTPIASPVEPPPPPDVSAEPEPAPEITEPAESTETADETRFVDKMRLAEIHYKNGLELHEQGQIEAARREYIKALEYYKGYPDAQYQLSLTYTDKADIEHARGLASTEAETTQPTPEPEPAPGPEPEQTDPPENTEEAPPVVEPEEPPTEAETPSEVVSEPVAEERIERPEVPSSGPRLSQAQLKQLFNKAYREDDLKEMRRLVLNYEDQVRELFDSYLSTLRQRDSIPLRQEAKVIARLFITEHNDESLMQALDAM